MKFVPPLVVNGRVYMPNHDNAVSVYGLLERPPDPDPSPGRTISIDFAGSAPVPMDATESAGVVAARNWNAAVGASRATPLPLVDSTGAPTSATVTWAAPSGIWQLPTTDQPGNARMMKGYLDTGNTTQVAVTVAGLPQATYDVYVYVDGDNKSSDRSATYTVSGAGLTTATIDLTDPANTNFNGDFLRVPPARPATTWCSRSQPRDSRSRRRRQLLPTRRAVPRSTAFRSCSERRRSRQERAR